ncbi:MAG TPA: helix-turn-helix domain-containing protein [Ktedonobacterales bacterium]|nr:helix-turn-helix domain-containing protein [Ktedonobacterales bacterium]
MSAVSKTARTQPASTKGQGRKQRARQPKLPVPRARPPYFNKLVYDVMEAADALGISVPTVNRLIYAVPPELRSMKIAKRRCVPVSAINEYIEQRMEAEAQKYSRTGQRRGRSA